MLDFFIKEAPIKKSTFQIISTSGHEVFVPFNPCEGLSI